jgi:hypothetical protein
MKIQRILAAVLLLALMATSSSFADDERKPFTDVTHTFNASFPKVWKSIQAAVKAFYMCEIEHAKPVEGDDGLFKGNIRSGYCVFERGSDTSLDSLKYYAIQAPFIRGAVWTAARIQFVFVVQEKEQGVVTVRMKSDLGGFEEFITRRAHFNVPSTGELETQMMNDIKRRVATASDDE